MSGFFVLVVNFFSQVFDLLNQISFEMGGFQVRYGNLIVAMIIFCFVISVFWRGAKS